MAHVVAEVEVHKDSLPSVPAIVTKAKAGKPKVIPFEGNRNSWETTPRVVDFDTALLKRFTPGKDSVPLPRHYLLPKPVESSEYGAVAVPETATAEELILCAPRIRRALHPEPIRTLPMQRNEQAYRDIQFLDLRQGLPDSDIHSLIQDKKGNIWIGSYRFGACRYDGTFLSCYGEDQGYTRAAICFYEDSKGNIWIGHWNGVSKYDGCSFTEYFRNSANSGMAVTSIVEDRHGDMWFATSRGIFRLRGDSLTQYTEAQGLNSNTVWSLMIDRKGRLWAGTSLGVSYFDGESFVQFRYFDGYHVRAIKEDLDGNIWFGTGWGAYKWDGNTLYCYDEESGLKSCYIWCLSADSRGNIWVGGFGAYKIQGNTITRYSVQEGFPEIKVRAIMEDKNHHMWFATRGGGIVRLREPSFSLIAQNMDPEQGDIKTILEDPDGNILFYQHKVGLFSFDGTAFLSYGELDEHCEVYTMHLDREKNLWLSSFCRLMRYDGDSVYHYIPDIPKNESLNASRTIFSDSDGDAWVGYWHGGLIRFDGTSFTSYKHSFLPKSYYGSFILRYVNQRISTIISDEHGTLWYAGGNTLYKLDGKQLTRFCLRGVDVTLGIKSSLMDRQGNILLGTDNQGILIFDGNSFKRIYQKDGLGNSEINSLVEDHLGRIWAGTMNGLYMIEYLGNKLLSVRSFGSSDGLRELSFNWNTVCFDSRNRLWWGTDNLLTMLDLNTFRFSSEKPVVQLTNVRINQEHMNFNSLPEDEKGISFAAVAPFQNQPLDLKLPFRKNNLSFTYSAIAWSEVEKLEYQYMLEGLDETWSKPTRENVVNYRNIPPGQYQFNIKAASPSGLASEIFSYPFTILHPWWASWYSYLAYVLILILLVRFYIRFIVNRERLKADYLVKQVEIDKMQEMDQMKSRFFASISHEFRTPLTLLLGPINDFMRNGKRFTRREQKMLGIMKRNAKRLQQLINQLLDISRLESGKLRIIASEGDLTGFVRILSSHFLSLAESKRINFQVELDETDAPCVFDRDKTEKILINLLSNAFKYTPSGGSVLMSLDYLCTKGSETQPSSARIRIEDTGRGIPEAHLSKIFNRFHQVDSSDTRSDASMGIGLSLTRELVTLLKGSIEVESEVGIGSVFTMVLPVSRDNYLNCEWVVPEKADEDLIHGDGIPVYLESIAEQAQIPPAEKSNGNPEILIVEDNADLREFISQKLNAQYLITEAVNGKEGMQMAMERIPDLIISDLMMPVMGGVRMCDKLKSDPKTSHIPIIMLTAKADKRSKLTGLETGVDDYVVKPFDSDELLARVRNLIRQRENLREKFKQEFVLESTDQVPVSPQDHLLQKILEILKKHIPDSDFHMNQLSEELNLSRAQLFRKVQAVTGYTPNDLLRKIRLKKAAELFDHGHTNISQVMYEVGFNNQSYFAKCFKELYHMNPSEYIKVRTSKELRA